MQNCYREDLARVVKMKKKFTIDRWIELLRSGRKFYRIADMMKLSGLNYAASRAAAHRLAKKGLLVRIGKELFGNMMASFSPEEAACQSYLPSYLSCEYALSRHGVIDQMAVLLTAVTLRRSKKAKIGQMEVVYRHLRKNLFWGYIAEGDSFIAEPEKALLDWLYLSKTPPSLDELNWDQLDKMKLKSYAKKFPNFLRRIPWPKE